MKSDPAPRQDRLAGSKPRAVALSQRRVICTHQGRGYHHRGSLQRLGQPDAQMLDQLVDLCVRTGEYKVAMQAVRALELVGAEVDKEKYKKYLLGKEEEITSIARQRERPGFAADERGDGETNNSSLERVQVLARTPEYILSVMSGWLRMGMVYGSESGRRGGADQRLASLGLDCLIQ